MIPKFEKLEQTDNEDMDKNSKFLIVIFIIIVLTSIFFTYKRSFIDRNFVIEEEEAEGEIAEEIY